MYTVKSPLLYLIECYFISIDIKDSSTFILFVSRMSTSSLWNYVLWYFAFLLELQGTLTRNKCKVEAEIWNRARSKMVTEPTSTVLSLSSQNEPTCMYTNLHLKFGIC